MSKKGKRYSEEEKQEVVDYVSNYNAEHNGRGGVANAARQFGITAMTVKAWVDTISADTSSTSYTSKKAVQKQAQLFQQLADLHLSISQKRDELARLEKQFETLKQKLDI